MAKVSICVPTYNNASEVERLLQSVHRQNYTDYEVNISDDSTNEETAELIERIIIEWNWCRRCQRQQPRQRDRI